MVFNGEEILATIGWDAQSLAVGAKRGPIAILYGEGKGELANQAIAEVTYALRQRGKALAGALPINKARDDRCRCDMELEDLRTGKRIPISEDRGADARGCKLDMSGLEEAVGLSLSAVACGADALIINRFGKAEAEGRGFRAAIAAAFERGIPVILAVGSSNIKSWQEFAGDVGVIYSLADLEESNRTAAE
ncbi:MAG: DUF2478 domain-containing protein [Hyphomicrobiales bacterium]|nr:MAG: DUF2478 domain-containing protein [Hyphomicrobiales bacterium]